MKPALEPAAVDIDGILGNAGFKVVLDSLREAVYVRDPGGRLLYFNPAAERLSGWSLHDALHSSCFEVFGDTEHPCDPISPSGDHRGEGSVLTRDGTLVGVAVSATPLRDGETIIGSVVLLERLVEGAPGADGSRESRARGDDNQAQLAEQTRFLQAVLDTINQGVCVYGPDGALAVWNRRYIDILDLPPGWARQGRSFESILRLNAERGEYGDGDTEQIVADRLAMFNHGTSIKAHHYERTRPDGTVVEVQGNPMPGGGLVATYTDITERRRAEQEIERLALQDSLTGLPNRNLFLRRLDDALALSEREGTLTAIATLDLDRFKVINDGFGHGLGNKLLCQVAQRLTEAVRSSDTVARLGGDEFALILPSLDDAREVIRPANRIKEALSAPFIIDGLTLNISTSIGFSFYPNDATTCEELIRQSDLALYDAKEAGRDTFRMFDAQLDERARAQRRIEENLRRALANDEFELHYQPVIALPDRNIVGVEALIRWRDPERGLIPPMEFIPIAEMCGLIMPIGDWVLREACRQAKQWSDDGLPPLRMAINISAPQFQGDTLVANVADALNDVGLAPEYLEIEINESMMMGNTDHATEQLQQLHDLGVSLAIDDFGTGYSSLAYLKNFPVHRLKIDRSFVDNITTDPTDAAITRTVVSLAKSLNLKVVAEGVETEEHVAFLLATQCDEVQGFHFSRPLPSEALVAWIREYGAPESRLGRSGAA